MPMPDTFKRTQNDEVVEFRSRVYGARVFRKEYPRPGGTSHFARTWCLRKMVGRTLQVFPLGTDMRTAEKLADEITAFLSIPSHTMDMAVAKYNPRRKAKGIATIGECLAAFEGALAIIGRRGAAVSVSSFKGYRSFLLTLVRKALAYRDGETWESFRGQSNVDFSPWLNRSTEILSARLVMDFKLASVPSTEDADEEEIQTAKISADTTLRNARAIFGERATAYFRDLGLVLPDLTGFMKEPDFGAKRFFELLPSEVIICLHRASLALRSENLDAYRAFLLCAHCGLRAGEAMAFVPEWLRMDDKPMLYVRRRGEFNPKHGKGRKVVLEKWVYATLEELGPVRHGDALEHLGTWIRGILPADARITKPIHELRKCWVSAKAKTEGLLAAAQQAGHSDPKVTQTHYGDNQMADRLIPFWQKPVEEALKIS